MGSTGYGGFHYSKICPNEIKLKLVDDLQNHKAFSFYGDINLFS